MPHTTDYDQLSLGTPPAMLLDGLLPQGGLACLYGHSGSGKTRLALQWAIEWSHGRPFAAAVPTRPLTTLFVEADMRQGSFIRFAQAASAAGLTPALSSIRVLEFGTAEYPSLADPAVRAALRAPGWRPDIIIVDTIDDMCSADPNVAREVQAVIQQWRTLIDPATATLFIRHARKRTQLEGPEPSASLDSLFGSQAWSKQLEFAAYLSSAKREPMLEYTKVRHMAPVEGVKLYRTEHGFFEAPSDGRRAAIAAAAAAHPTLTERQLCALIEEQYHIPRTTTQRYLRQLLTTKVPPPLVCGD